VLEKAQKFIFIDGHLKCEQLDRDIDALRKEVGEVPRGAILAWTCRSPLESLRWLRLAECLGVAAMPVRFELERELDVLGRHELIRDLRGAAIVRAPELNRATAGCHYLNMSSGTSMNRTIAFPQAEQVEANSRACIDLYGLGPDRWYWCTFPFYAHAHEVYAKSIFAGTPVLAFPSNAIETVNELLAGECRRLHILTTPHVALNFLSRHLRPDDPAKVRFELAGEYVSIGVVQRLRRQGFEVAISWGSAETTGVALADLDPRVAFSIGSPLPGYEVAADDEGRMTVEGPALPPYLYEQGRLRPTRGFFRSSDSVTWDGQRFLFRGRTDRQIKFRGTYIRCCQVEGWAKQFDAVDNGFLVVNELDSETRLELHIQCRDRKLWPAIRSEIKSRMYRSYGGIRLHLVITEELPHTPTGKLIRHPGHPLRVS